MYLTSYFSLHYSGYAGKMQAYREKIGKKPQDTKYPAVLDVSIAESVQRQLESAVGAGIVAQGSQSKLRAGSGMEYEFVEILDPVSEFLPRDRTKIAPVAEFEHEDSLWKMYVIDDETVTGIQCHSGFWGYLSIEEHPALVLLDASQWTDGEITFDLRYQVPPALDFTTQNYGSSFYFHEGFQYYLYDCLVNYDDGTNPPGSYSLEAEELWELADILISMPESITNLYPSEDVDGLLYFDRKTVPKNPQVYMQLRFDDHSLYSWGDSGVHRKPWGDVRLELFYGDDTITLGVNMEDLDQIRYNDIYYFELKSDELKAFMLDKCNNSRKSISLG